MAKATNPVVLESEEHWVALSAGEDTVIVQGYGVDLALAAAIGDLTIGATRYGHTLNRSSGIASFTGLDSAGLNVYGKAVGDEVTVVVTKY